MKLLELLKKYWPVLLLVVVFFGLFYDRSAERQLRLRLEKERDEINSKIDRNLNDIHVLGAREDSLAKKMERDSIKFIEAYKLSNAEIYRLNKIIREIDFSKSTVAELDSIRKQLYSTKPLHSDR
jgi:hypothetical protein